MKKGDVRRQEILKSAEKLFFEKGYEGTSVQDVLDDLHLSKGGFYHHFESKQQLLEAICADKCAQAFERFAAISRRSDTEPIRRLNTLFCEGGFFGERSIKYFTLLLQNAYGENMCAIRDLMRNMQLDNYAPILHEILLDGIAQKVFYVVYPDRMARILIMLACDLNDDIACIMAKPREERGDMAQIIDLIDAYRKSVELLLNAPYGSVEVADVGRITELLGALNTEGVRLAWKGEY